MKVLPAFSQKSRKIAFISTACLAAFVSPPLALVIGFAFSYFMENPFSHLSQKATNWLLKASVVGLGFGMNAHQALLVGKQGLDLTIASITITLCLGLLIGKALHITPKIAHLVASGTAICGGSAIAAIAPVVKANEKEMSVSLGTVFLLNALALLIFPVVGHYFHLSQYQFGLWSAIAIHDTSSVVGAASAYGAEALEIATTVKLARALWIIPVAVITSVAFKTEGSKIQIPWFIGLFVLAMLLNSYVPFIAAYSLHITGFSKVGLTLTLFFIGAGLSVEKLKAVGWRPLLLGSSIWTFISVVSLWVIKLM